MITLGFSYKKENIVSKTISEITAGKYSHCFIIIEKMADDYLILESSMLGGVKFNLLSKYQNDKYETDILVIPGTLELGPLLPYFGKNYGYFQAIGIWISKLLGRSTNIFTDNIICSELVLLSLLYSKDCAPFFAHLNLNTATPTDIYKIAKQIAVKKTV